MNVLILLLGLFSPFLSADSPVQSAFLGPAGQELISAPLQAVQPAALEPAEEDRYIREFDSLAGVRLYASKEELIEIKGQPLSIAPDPWGDSLEYRYADMSAGISGGAVSYIHVSPQQMSVYGLRINDTQIDPVRDTLKSTLGSPDFVAEDGDVYMRGHTAIKVYQDRETGEWQGIDLFDDFSS